MSASKQYAPKTAPQPKSSLERYAAVPRELIERKQWVAWKSVPNPKRRKPEKKPLNPRTGKPADTTDTTTWGTYAEAVARCQRDHLDGIGFVLTALDPFVGIDLDHCRNADTNEMDAWARGVIQILASYTEISPSGTGVRIFVSGKLPSIGRKKGDIEVYEAGRYLTITGNHLDGTPQTIENRQDELTAWHASVWTLRQANPLAGEKLGGEHANTTTGVLACNSSSIPLRSRFQGLSWSDGLSQAMLVRDHEVQKAIVAHLERDAGLVDEVFAHSNGLSQRFECPFHEESQRDKPLADLAYYAETDTVKVRCHHRGAGGMGSRGIGLIDWYAWKQTEEYHNLTKAELKLWTLRLFIDMGLINGPDVERRPLPDELPADAPERLRAVYYGIVERMRVQEVIGKGFVPLAHKFLAHWCGVSEHAVAKCMEWLLKPFYLKGGVFLRKDGTLSKTREDKMQPECFVLSVQAKAWKPKGKTYVHRERWEWRKFYDEKREMENAEAVCWHQYEEAERRGDFDDLDDWDPDALAPDFDDEEALDVDDEPLDPEILAIVEAMGSEVDHE